MYICQECNNLIGIRQKQYSLTVETRSKTYYIYHFRKKRGKGPQKIIHQYIEENKDIIDIMKKENYYLHELIKKNGWEIVKEKKVCSNCFIKGEKNE